MPPTLIEQTQPELRVLFSETGAQLSMRGQVSPRELFLAAGLIERMANAMIDQMDMAQMQAASMAQSIIRDPKRVG